MDNLAYVINKIDNVATALSNLSKTQIKLTGETNFSSIFALEEIKAGHKIALYDINEGDEIIKYGIPIGIATKKILKGTYVHLHCMKSQFDERSSHLDINTGVPINQKYEN